MPSMNRRGSPEFLNSRLGQILQSASPSAVGGRRSAAITSRSPLATGQLNQFATDARLRGARSAQGRRAFGDVPERYIYE